MSSGISIPEPVILTLKYTGNFNATTFHMNLGYMVKEGVTTKFKVIKPFDIYTEALSPVSVAMNGQVAMVLNSLVISEFGEIEFQTITPIIMPMLVNVEPGYVKLKGEGGQPFGGFNGVVRF
jgi:hypothetical protein